MSAEHTAWLRRKLEARGLLHVVEHCAREHHVTVDDVLSNRRTISVVAARHAAMRDLRKHGLSLPEIGELLGRDHTTVMSALAKTGIKTISVAQARAALRVI